MKTEPRPYLLEDSLARTMLRRFKKSFIFSAEKSVIDFAVRFNLLWSPNPDDLFGATKSVSMKINPTEMMAQLLDEQEQVERLAGQMVEKIEQSWLADANKIMRLKQSLWERIKFIFKPL